MNAHHVFLPNTISTKSIFCPCIHFSCKTGYILLQALHIGIAIRGHVFSWSFLYTQSNFIWNGHSIQVKSRVFWRHHQEYMINLKVSWSDLIVQNGLACISQSSVLIWDLSHPQSHLQWAFLSHQPKHQCNSFLKNNLDWTRLCTMEFLTLA